MRITRELQAMGHDVRQIPPANVKPFVKRNKNDAIDAEAICEAAQRPDMRFVGVKNEEQQAAALVFRTRDLVVRQRTQFIDSTCGHLAEYGWVAPRGTAKMTLLASHIDEEEMASTMPESALSIFELMFNLLTNSPTRWREWPGRCLPRTKIAELRQLSRHKPRQQSDASGR